MISSSCSLTGDDDDDDLVVYDEGVEQLELTGRLSELSRRTTQETIVEQLELVGSVRRGQIENLLSTPLDEELDKASDGGSSILGDSEVDNELAALQAEVRICHPLAIIGEGFCNALYPVMDFMCRDLDFVSVLALQYKKMLFSTLCFWRRLWNEVVLGDPSNLLNNPHFHVLVSTNRWRRKSRTLGVVLY